MLPAKISISFGFVLDQPIDRYLLGVGSLIALLQTISMEQILIVEGRCINDQLYRLKEFNSTGSDSLEKITTSKLCSTPNLSNDHSLFVAVRKLRNRSAFAEI